jgi:hypothetical protein
MYWMQFEMLLFCLAAWKLGLHLVSIVHFLEIPTLIVLLYEIPTLLIVLLYENIYLWWVPSF